MSRIAVASIITTLALTPVVATAAPARDRWGLTADDWLRLDGPQFREKLGFQARRGEIERAAAEGDVEAMTIWAGAASNHEVPGADPELIRRYAEAGAARGILRASYTLALLTIGEPPQPAALTAAMPSLLRIAEAGLAPAMGYLAVMYEYGPARDKAASLYWARRAAEAGEIQGIYVMGVHYWQGTPTMVKDPGLAKAYMHRAAVMGVTDAMFWYGVALGDETMSPGAVDLAASTAWIGRAADKGSPDGRYYYALRLQGGYGVTADPLGAAAWFERGADAGDARAQLGLCAMYGDDRSGVSRNIPAAARLCRQVIDNRTASRDLIGLAYYNLGLFAQLNSDTPTARASYETARQMGAPEAAKAIAALDRQLAQAQADALREQQAAQALAVEAQARRAVTAAQSAANGGGPSINQIADLLARSSRRYFGGQLTSTPGEQAYESPFGGTAYYVRRRIFNVACVKVSIVTYRCSFDSDKQQVPASDSLYGAFVSVRAAFTGANGIRHWNDTFVRSRNGGWTSSTADSNNYQAALAQARQSQVASQNSWSSSASDTARDDRVRNCNSQVYSSMMSGDYSTAAAMSIVPCM